MYSFESKQELTDFIKQNLISAKEASEILHCSRANIADLVKRNKLTPAFEISQTKLFWKDEIVERANSDIKVGRPRNVN